MDIPPNIERVKIDIGLGQWNANSIEWLCNDKNLFVCMFDASPKSIYHSTLKMQSYLSQFEERQNKYVLYNLALGDIETPTTMEFYEMQNDSGTSSLYKPSSARLGPVGSKISVNVIPLKKFLDGFPWERFEYIEYLKIDAQGSDLDVLKSAGKYLSERIVYVTAEPESEDYIGCSHNTVKNITDYMTSQNFIKVDHPNTRDPTYLNVKFIHLRNSIYIYQG